MAKAVSVEEIKTAVRAVLEDGANQHQYPYLLVQKVMAAFDDPASVAVAGDGRTEVSAPVAEPQPEAKPEKKPKLSKEERVKKMREGKAKKAAAKLASDSAASSDKKAKAEPEVKAQAESSAKSET